MLAISLDRQMFKALLRSKFSSFNSLSFVVLSCSPITIRSLINSSVSVPNLHVEAAFRNLLTNPSMLSSGLCTHELNTYLSYTTLVFGLKYSSNAVMLATMSPLCSSLSFRLRNISKQSFPITERNVASRMA